MNSYEPENLAFIKQERQRIHRDAHDKVYNRLGALAKRAENLACEPTLQKDKLEEISQSIRQAISDLQDIISGKSSTSLMALAPSDDEIRQICAEHVINYGQQIAFTCHSGDYNLLDNRSIWHLHCIMQECLNNAGKHSGATRININLMEDSNQLIMRVSDNGKGLPKVKLQTANYKDIRQGSEGQGLKSIKQRVASLGGKLDLQSSSQGITITVKVPLKKDEDN